MTYEELVSKTNAAISELVYDKVTLRNAYNYYNCERDKELFKFLEDNYGIGSPTQVEFIPLIKKHIDALIGEYLDMPIKAEISCKDEKTINNIYRDKQLKIANECYNLLLQNLKNNLLRFLDNKNLLDLNIKELLDKLKEDVEENFISEYEIAAHNIIKFIKQSRNIDLTTKLKLLYLDLLVTGFTFYRVFPANKNILIECLNPLDVFPELNYNSPYINECKRIVVRKYLSRLEILNKYGKKLSKEDLEKIKDNFKEYSKYSESYIVRSYTNSVGYPITNGIRAGEEVDPINGHWYNLELIPVYEVEWIETDKNFVELLYGSVRIGDEIYIVDNKSKDVVRTMDAPEKCYLTVNGVWFNNRGSKPYSMAINCMVLQDKYDIATFYRDKLLANSGSVGDYLNIPTLPAFLGDTLPERIVKWLAYKKQGVALMDTSLEGQVNTGQAPLNTLVNGYDDTIKVQAIQAIQLVIDSIEQTVSSITGVFRERLNGILQRDAVTNVQVGINNSFVVTKQWTFQMDLVMREILLDSLNCAKIVYNKGLTGTLILGHNLLKTFTALPKYYTVTDFDIHVLTSSEIVKDIELIKALIPELVKSNIAPPEIIVEMLTAKSLSEAKSIVKKGIKKLKLENNLILQLTQNLEEAQNTIQQLEDLLNKSLLKLEQLNEAKLLLEQQKIKLQNEVDMFKAKTDRTYKESQAENDTKRTQIELMLLYDGNPYNDEVRNV